jgi:hypothetical protein
MALIYDLRLGVDAFVRQSTTNTCKICTTVTKHVRAYFQEVLLIDHPLDQMQAHKLFDDLLWQIHALQEEYGHFPNFSFISVYSIKYKVERMDTTTNVVFKPWTLDTLIFMGPKLILTLLSHLITDMMEDIKEKLEFSPFSPEIWDESVPVIEDFKESIPELIRITDSVEPAWTAGVKNISSFVLKVGIETS